MKKFVWKSCCVLLILFVSLSVLLQGCPGEPEGKTDTPTQESITEPVTEAVSPKEPASNDAGPGKEPTTVVDAGPTKEVAPTETVNTEPPADEPTTTGITWANDIVPLFKRSNCSSGYCHGGPGKSGGLNMDNGPSSVVNVKNQAGDTDLVVPGEPEKSYLYMKISQEKPPKGEKMPIGSSLTSRNIQLVYDWIKQGAK